MATFKYIARSNPSQVTEGRIEAESVMSAARHLRTQGLYPFHIEMHSGGVRRLAWLTQRWGLRKVGLAPLAEFTDQLADLLEAGIPLERALRLQTQHVSKTALKSSLDSLAESVCAGKSLAEAMAAWPKVFPQTYASMVKVGEEAGLLTEMLRRLAKSLDEEHQLRSKLRAAMVYPLFLVCVGLGTVLVLMVWVIPKFGSFFESLEQQLPLATRIVIGMSSVMGKAAPLLVAGGLLAVFLTVRLLRVRAVKLRFDRLCLHVPVMGGLILKFHLARLMRTLGLLLSHGVNMLGALRITAETLSNRYIAGELVRASEQMAKGVKLHECFSGGDAFPASVVGLIAMGAGERQSAADAPPHESAVRAADRTAHSDADGNDRTGDDPYHGRHHRPGGGLDADAGVPGQRPGQIEILVRIGPASETNESCICSAGQSAFLASKRPFDRAKKARKASYVTGEPCFRHQKRCFRR